MRGLNEAAIRARCHSVALSPSQVLARVLGRYKMYVDPNDYGLSPHLMLDGFWEMPTTEAIVNLVEPGMVAADVGANVGYFTMMLADLVGPGGHVYAFEPNPAMSERIARSAYLNGLVDRISIHAVALSVENKAVSFVMPSDEPKNAYILPFHGEVPTGGVVIDAERLDNRAEWAAIEFLKIDAEGAEEQIWIGAQGLRVHDRLRTIVLEFRPGRYADAHAYLQDIMSWGFSLEWISSDHGIETVSVATVLASNPDEDVMLVFRR